MKRLNWMAIMGLGMGLLVMTGCSKKLVFSMEKGPAQEDQIEETPAPVETAKAFENNKAKKVLVAPEKTGITVMIRTTAGKSEEAGSPRSLMQAILKAVPAHRAKNLPWDGPFKLKLKSGKDIIAADIRKAVHRVWWVMSKTQASKEGHGKVFVVRANGQPYTLGHTKDTFETVWQRIIELPQQS
ncbi:MAG: hypothetical protein EP343_24815 [Deltaproteobacteria bacterium]|nr:MAG: hypothetical protein EP343_24815 [Deltaproteobacteria bacterium]